MKINLLELLRCPQCVGELDLATVIERNGSEIETGTLKCARCATEFPIARYVPRFVPASNYCGNFGFQWNRFSRTQLDSSSGHSISRERFLAQTGWTEKQMRGATILDAGCGSGRFAEVALDSGATVVAVDYSSAIDACRKNLGDRPNFHAVQADIRRLPFCDGGFDHIYSFGVLQHTPDPHSSFLGLPRCLKKGGSLAVDVYRRTWKCLFMPKYWMRPITKRMPPELLFRFVKVYVPVLLPVSSIIAKVPKLGGRLRYLVPISNYAGVLPLSNDQLREWAILDTFDMLSPAYDRPQTSQTIREWFQQAGFGEVQVDESYLAVGRGAK
jgi:ubiquinone/menaquinone biosynthesis C-methylase UbiE/uncharacterized protein YbaR (Trm112 family)